MNNQDNIELKKGFTQVVVWEGVIIPEDETDRFETFIKDELDCGVQFLETILTLPTEGKENTGGRSDVFFAIADEDLDKFPPHKVTHGMRWIEDVIANEKLRNRPSIHPERIEQYQSWDGTINESSKGNAYAMKTACNHNPVTH